MIIEPHHHYHCNTSKRMLVPPPLYLLTSILPLARLMMSWMNHQRTQTHGRLMMRVTTLPRWQFLKQLLLYQKVCLFLCLSVYIAYLPLGPSWKRQYKKNITSEGVSSFLTFVEALRKLVESPPDSDVKYQRLKKDIFHAFNMIIVPTNHGM